MRILSIETSCDETAISLLQASKTGSFKVLQNALFSQAK
ncbi:MAG TPA: tRNA (adenosine(37)-N6)-threonylcarbamoyltransferase complex transferase subunit TsaD, partial [Candidatus Paceibacterota bacterium]|nr:tRNA (adenosine(37)-N6)-threonylcarbamoyltransferase complex transferase subunit TsaD [Candidatus Paceibacterota bacterium]